MKEKFKLGIVIFACDKIDKYREQIRVLNQTWVKKANEYSDIKTLFFIGEQPTKEFKGDSYINLKGVNDDYFSVTHKQYEGIKYFYDNYDCDFIYCCGTDTYINIPKLYKYLDNFNPNEKLYIGGNGCYRTIDDKSYYYHSGGPGFIISRETTKELVPLINNNIIDEWFNKCDITPEIMPLKVACDVSLSYYVQNPPIEATVVKAKIGEFCWLNHNSDEYDKRKIIACHNMTIFDCYDFTNILEHNNYFL
jgi:hypothetical protein